MAAYASPWVIKNMHSTIKSYFPSTETCLHTSLSNQPFAWKYWRFRSAFPISNIGKIHNYHMVKNINSYLKKHVVAAIDIQWLKCFQNTSWWYTPPRFLYSSYIGSTFATVRSRPEKSRRINIRCSFCPTWRSQLKYSTTRSKRYKSLWLEEIPSSAAASV